MMIHEITEKVGRHRAAKRIGRGEGSGRGGTSGRGHKGAKSRSGYKRRAYYEGGQVPLVRRLPKRGFSNVNFENAFAIVNVKQLEAAFETGAEVTAESAAKAGLIRNAALPLKVLGEGELKKKLTVTAAKFSESARSKIEAAGGTCSVVVRRKWTRTTVSGEASESAAPEQKPAKKTKKKAKEE